MVVTPKNGARFLLLREQVDDVGAQYRGEILQQGATARYSIVIALGGSSEPGQSTVTVRPDPESDGDAPEWATAYLATLAKQLGRSASRDGKWTRRVLRWKGVGREG